MPFELPAPLTPPPRPRVDPDDTEDAGGDISPRDKRGLVGWPGPLEAEMTSKSCQNLPVGIEICLIKICLSSDQNPHLSRCGWLLGRCCSQLLLQVADAHPPSQPARLPVADRLANPFAETRQPLAPHHVHRVKTVAFGGRELLSGLRCSCCAAPLPPAVRPQPLSGSVPAVSPRQRASAPAGGGCAARGGEWIG